jgi:hypothetical protein
LGHPEKDEKTEGARHKENPMTPLNIGDPPVNPFLPLQDSDGEKGNLIIDMIS